MSKRKTGVLILCGYSLILLGIIVFVRPLIVRTWEKIAALDFLYGIVFQSNAPADMKEKVFSYNNRIREEQKAYGFVCDTAYDDLIYDSLLKGTSGMLCVVEIPAIHVLLPVGHGTGTELLRNAAGHVHGSSLPTGGPSTHAVIAAHAGMPDRELFTNLPKMMTGDIFYVYVLGEKHAYKIRKMMRVLPSESEALTIREGEDLVTLMTCIPYGVNSHRLLVQGVRCGGEETQAAEDLKKAKNKTYAACFLHLTELVILPAVLPVLYIIGTISRTRKS